LNIFQAIVLGLVQGLTEFLPVSSSGHLILVPWAFGWQFFLENPDLNKTFDVALHLGTFVALLVFFWREVLQLLAAFFGSLRRRRVRAPQERLAWLLLLSTIPAGVAGLLLEDFIQEGLGDPWLIAVLLMAFGLVMLVVDRWAARRRGLDDMRWRDALIIGLAQALALAPGVSRSGITMVTARALQMEREPAVRYSFLMSIPIIGAAAGYKLIGVAFEGLPPGTALPFVVGMLTAAGSGLAAVWFLLTFVRRHSFDVFVAYRFLLGAGVLLALALGWR